MLLSSEDVRVLCAYELASSSENLRFGKVRNCSNELLDIVVVPCEVGRRVAKTDETLFNSW